MTTNNIPKGDRLDAVFAELDTVTAALAPYDEELRTIDFTPSGRLRTRLTPRQQARRDAITAETADLLARQRDLTRQACRIVAE